MTIGITTTLFHGRRFPTLSIFDEGVREALDIVIDTSITGGSVVRTLEHPSRWRGLPRAMRCGNGAEILSQAFLGWCESHEVQIRYIEPAKSNQNALIERFNRTCHGEVLDAHLFENLNQVRELTYWWLETYNETRPHDALGRVPPVESRRRLEDLEVSTSELST